MKHLIFDFDGVIGDTKEAALYGLVKSGREVDRESAIRNVEKYSSNRPHHANGHSMTDEELAEEYRWVSDFGTHIHSHGFNLFDEFVAEIEELETTFKAVVSSGSQNYVLPALARTNINPTHILAFENHHSKEEKIEIVCRDWGVKVSDVYYFTDTLADVFELGSLIAKEKLIGVSWGFCSKEQLLQELTPEHILDEPADLGKLFGNI